MGGKDPNDGTFHHSFVRDKGEGRGVRVATVKATDLQKIDGPALSRQDASKGAQARKTKLAVMGLSADLLDAGDPRYAQCIRLANAFRKTRTKEMYEAHGYVSSGVSALLAASAMALAASRFCYEVAASTEDGRTDLLSKAAKLSDSARQNELSAWELCAREAVIRKRNLDANAAMPWITGVSGQEKRKPGRPRKNQYNALQEANYGGQSKGQTQGTGQEGGEGPERQEEGVGGEGPEESEPGPSGEDGQG